MSDNQTLQLVECPRDSMQGWPFQIPAFQKAAYINALLNVGFHTIDFGSFVSPKAIPQMADTREVLETLDLGASRSALLAIIANMRGAEEAASYDVVRYLGFPFSVSETFQQRNTNSSIEQSLSTVENIQAICRSRNKELVVYLSMGFGNPYGDPWSEEIVFNWARKLSEMGVGTISLADTVGLASPDQVFNMTSFLLKELPSIRIGVHLHAAPNNWRPKLDAAFRAGCRRFDSALKGIGGCPMAGNALVGNLDTENMVAYLEEAGVNTGLNQTAMQKCSILAKEIFALPVL
ncbi:hydroxymethylglutaryl-CoA lyase [Flavihumibacter stibioxidans]|uniref:Hydroxymethylglutaryl-CoA lyase n=1 Tax=Flavihumibacter stibioxidans TaxID=1834163 RepID=A0ABR7M5I9_9BACT|nr:hydroxymethylglutaryl-CoA lyase [Flavihumibacter stibioxidans]MBC6489789.1 hydroxymethylglutaryl-CoA lyase [Flavihumibacter stibioxidans]